MTKLLKLTRHGLPILPLLEALCLSACRAPDPASNNANKGGTGSDSRTASSGARGPARIEVTAEVANLLTQIIKAYEELNMAELDGNIWARFEMTDGEKEFTQKFHSAFHGPNQFKHVLEQELLIGSSGDKVFLYQNSANAFFETNVNQVSAGTLPPLVVQLLQAQNPSLLMALARNPLAPLGMEIEQISRVEDAAVDGVSCPALSIKSVEANFKVLMLVDPESKLLKRLRVDIGADDLKAGGEMGFKRVLTEVTYTTIKTAPDFEPAFFDWSPPEGSERMSSLQEEGILKTKAD